MNTPDIDLNEITSRLINGGRISGRKPTFWPYGPTSMSFAMPPTASAVPSSLP